MSQLEAYPPKGPQPRWLDRALRPLSDVRPGEAGTALLMLANLFLLLVGYYVLKTVREPLILATGGAEMKSYAAAGQALLIMGLIPLYGWLASRVDRMKLIACVVLFFIADIELFYLGGRAGVRYLGILFYVWVGVFSLISIAQFWSYADDLYRKEAGDRLFPLIAVGATVGSPVGAWMAGRLFATGMEPYAMLQITVGVLLAHLGLYWLVNRREARRGAQAPEANAPLEGPGGFTLVLRSHYLRLVALLVVLLNLVNSTGEYIIGHSVVAAANAAAAADPAVHPGAFIGSFYGSYFFYTNVVALVLQVLVVSRLVKFTGLGGVLLALPLVALGSYGLVSVGVGLAVLRWVKIAENSTDYSIMNTARQLLWLPTSRAEKYKAKQVGDSFFVRAGDILSAGLVLVGTTWVPLGVSGFGRVNLVLVLLWLSVALLILREHRALMAAPSAGRRRRAAARPRPPRGRLA